MRGLRTPVSDLRKSIFTEVAKIAYEADSANLNDAVEAVPYTVCPGDVPTYRESIYRERAIAAERVRLAMGMSLRPQDKPVQSHGRLMPAGCLRCQILHSVWYQKTVRTR